MTAISRGAAVAGSAALTLAPTNFGNRLWKALESTDGWRSATLFWKKDSPARKRRTLYLRLPGAGGVRVSEVMSW